jgi:hypothetical protein
MRTPLEISTRKSATRRDSASGFVAQILNLLYRRIVFCGPVAIASGLDWTSARLDSTAHAECNSAIQQIQNLRYGNLGFRPPEVIRSLVFGSRPSA